MSPVELRARQCTICIEEVYDASGQRVVATQARAIGDDDTITVTSDAPADTPKRLADLLRRLGMAIGEAAAK